ncbi:GNAT family N-acetyltransferase [Neobacillus soli]|uniref:GNAT family N-acetyltransferase n=1 Tax=Neobacillus soli TaxID=220688 RepID=UPI000826CC85|nr:GNAT family N-acetyltransferase [Neobacillus soli]
MDCIFEGIVKQGGGNIEVPFYVRKLTVDDLRDILLLQEQVVLQLEDKWVLQPLSEEEFQFILTGNGLMIGAFAAGELIAFRALLVPPLDEEHLGWDLGLAERELPRVIYQEISSVLPEYRGNGLQKTLAKLIMEELGRQNNKFRYICCTVAPFNIPSLKDKFAQGMQIGALKEKYGGRLRYIFVKELAEGNEGAIPVWKEITTIHMADIAAQKEKLSQGWRGFQMEENHGTISVNYGRR